MNAWNDPDNDPGCIAGHGAPVIAMERHFDGREVRCFRDRPPHVLALLDDAVRDHSDREAVVTAARRLTYAELGELVLGTKQGRSADDQVTFFKSVGIAAQDACAAQVALANAKSRNLGQRVDW